MGRLDGKVAVIANANNSARCREVERDEQGQRKEQIKRFLANQCHDSETMTSSLQREFHKLGYRHTPSQSHMNNCSSEQEYTEQRIVSRPDSGVCLPNTGHHRKVGWNDSRELWGSRAPKAEVYQTFSL